MANGNGDNKFTRWIMAIYNNRPAFELFKTIVDRIIDDRLAKYGFIKPIEDVKNDNDVEKTSDITR